MAIVVPCATFAPVWQPFVVMPACQFSSVQSALPIRSCDSMMMGVDAAGSPSCENFSITGNEKAGEPALISPPLPALASVVSSNGEAAESEASISDESLCGNGQCRPCYDHIRGKCMNADTCTYCHAPIHAIRRKQRKHQRRAQAFKQNVSDDSQVTSPSANAACGNDDQQSRCQPCFRHFRGLCVLGAECAYSHDPVHALRHNQNKQARSAKRSAGRHEVLES